MGFVNGTQVMVEGYRAYIEHFECFVSEKNKNEGMDRLLVALEENIDMVSDEIIIFTFTCEVKESLKNQYEHIIYEFSVEELSISKTISVVYKGAYI